MAAQRLSQGERVGPGLGARGETGHGDGVDALTRQAEAVDGTGGDDERVGGVQAAADPDDDPGKPDGPQPLDQTGHLNVVGLVAVPGQAGRVVGDEGEAVDDAAQADIGTRGGQRAASDTDDAEPTGIDEGRGALIERTGRTAAGERHTVVIEGALAQPLGDQPFDIDVDDRGPRSVGEALGLAEQGSVLVDEGLPVPGQVRRRLPLTGRGEDVGGQVARG